MLPEPLASHYPRVVVQRYVLDAPSDTLFVRPLNIAILFQTIWYPQLNDGIYLRYAFFT